MEMLPIECVVRGYFMAVWLIDGILVKLLYLLTLTLNLQQKLSTPLFDPTTKSEHDVPITKVLLYNKTLSL